MRTVVVSDDFSVRQNILLYCEGIAAYIIVSLSCVKILFWNYRECNTFSCM